MDSLLSILQNTYRDRDAVQRQREREARQREIKQRRIQREQKANRDPLQKAMDKDNVYALLAQNYETYKENKDTTMNAEDQIMYEDEQKEFNKNLAIQGILDQGGTYTTAGGIKYEKEGDKTIITKGKDMLDIKMIIKTIEMGSKI